MPVKIEKSPSPLSYFTACLDIKKASFEMDDIAESEGRFFELFQHGDYDIFLAKNGDGEVIGYLIGQLEDKKYHVISIGVDPNYRHQHVGTALMQDLDKENPNTTIVLECRPYNEPFYRNLGFKPVCLPKTNTNNQHDDYYHVNYYQYFGISVHSIFMQKTASMQSPTVRALLPKKWVTPDQENYELYRRELLELAKLMQSSTSRFYRGIIGFFLCRTERKEKAFTAIISELEALGSVNTKIRRINPADILQAIAHNATIIRGSSVFSSKTTSGKALVKYLNDPRFANLRALTSKCPITYDDLKLFAQSDNVKSKSIPKPYSPYRHF